MSCAKSQVNTPWAKPMAKPRSLALGPWQCSAMPAVTSQRPALVLPSALRAVMRSDEPDMLCNNYPPRIIYRMALPLLPPYRVPARGPSRD